MQSKLQTLAQCAAAGDWQQAIAIAAKFQDLGAARDAVLRAHGAYGNPAFYAQLGHGLEAAKAAGKAALMTKYFDGKEPTMTADISMLTNDREIALTGSNIMALLGTLTGQDNPGRAKTKDAAAQRFALAAKAAGIDFMPILGAPDFGEASRVLGTAMQAAEDSRGTVIAVAKANSPASIDAAARKVGAAIQKAKAVNAANVAKQPAPAVREAGAFIERPVIKLPSGGRAAALRLVASQPAIPVAAKAKAKAAPASGKRAEAKAAALAAAQAGELPEAPDFSAPTHKPFVKALAAIKAMVEAGNIAGLKADTMAPKSSSRAILCRYRDLAITALEAKAAKAKAS